MMLQALIAYAERNALGDADFENVSVRWLIPLDKTGRPAGGPIPLTENPDDKKPKPKQMIRPFTSPNELNQGTKSHFLCDTLERATLFLDLKWLFSVAPQRSRRCLSCRILAATGRAFIPAKRRCSGGISPPTDIA